ncbi:hypothetical protein CLIM01_09403 [Colletotrichum limetticola]|uniref:Uncharacterized protein n=1 Tax=Colletotrichum limetticola TaxID=1209924 RepID=A0ABQ9PNV9_9PEZI|nr:hypothetical protein CLIM01_09403 [Colletotrichum limetticola]
MRRGGIEPPAPRRCLMATENFTTKPSTQMIRYPEIEAGRASWKSGCEKVTIS